MTIKACISTAVLFQSLILLGQQEDKWISIDYQTKYAHEHIKMNNISNYAFFLHGETHTVESIPQTRMNFFRYYYKEANVRNLVIEAGYASAYLLNLYLETGDESYVCKDFNFFSHPEYREFWRELYELNTTLKEPIKVVGIDDLESTLAWFKAMEVLFHDKPYQSLLKTDTTISQILTISEKINQIVEKNGISRKRMNSLKEAFILNYKNYPDLYADVLQQDSIYLRLIIQNNLSSKRTRHTDKNMFDNLNRIIEAEQVNVGNFFGQFGSFHVRGFRSLTYYLNDLEESPFYRKVLTVLPEYINCNWTELIIGDSTVNMIIRPLKSRRKNKINSLSTYSYILEELKNKQKNPNKYTLYVKNKGAMRFDFPEVCD
ncbi:MAG: hypothetical protein P8I82_02450 [Flavobacteriales bacterium]|nr:hypothetical protein [Flavobacteriales bacterium]